MRKSFADMISCSRKNLYPTLPSRHCKAEEEGGCGVTGFACSIPVGGKHIFEPSIQMHNRGNGKGGGIAAAGLIAEDLGVTKEILDECYLVQVFMWQYWHLDLQSRASLTFVDPVERKSKSWACLCKHLDQGTGRSVLHLRYIG